MKKILLLAFSCTLSFFTSNAQIKPGLDLGFSLTNSTTTGTDALGNETTTQGDMKPAFRGGVIVDFLIVNNFSIQPGLFYTMKNWQYDYLSQPINLNGGTVGTYTSTTRDIIHTLELPIYFLYKTSREGRGRFFAGVGGYASYSLAGKRTNKMPLAVVDTSNDQGYIIKTLRNKSNLRFGNDTATNIYNPYNYGVGACIGYETSNGVYFRSQFQKGLSNAFTNDTNNRTLKDWSITFSIGIYLGNGGGGYDW